MAPAMSTLLLAASAALGLGAAAAAPAAVVKGQHFDRIMIVNFENQAYEDVMKDSNFASFAKKGRILTNYYAITHPSQPNYMCQVAGATFVQDDSNQDIDACNVADLLEAKGVAWKAYQEGYPGNCFLGKSSGKYYRKHNPLISFTSIHSNPKRCANVVSADQLQKDIASKSLPQYMYYTPDIDNDGHNTGIPFAGTYLASFLPPLLADPYFSNGTLVVLTWDEDDGSHGNHIYTTLIGPMIPAGSSDNARYNHFSLLRTVEDNWQLGSCKRNDSLASPFAF